MRFRLPIVLVFLFAFAGGAIGPAKAQTVPIAWPDKTHLIGLVTDVVGPAGDPTGFTLQLGTMTADVGTVPRTRFVARSLEAQVEKFVVGDYALVLIRKTKVGVVAARITYDVVPFPPLRELNGTIQWVRLDQLAFRLRMDPGNRIVVLRIRPQTRFHVDGRPVDIVPTLARGQDVQVLALQRNGFDAYEIDLVRSAYTMVRGGQ